MPQSCKVLYQKVAEHVLAHPAQKPGGHPGPLGLHRHVGRRAPRGLRANSSLPSSVCPTGVKSIKSSPMDKSCAIFQTAFPKIDVLC